MKTQGGTKGVKARQAQQLKNDFEKALGDYQQEEVAYRQRYRDQIARQYRIVNPEASEAEVQEASELDWGSEGVFQTAVSLPMWFIVFSVYLIDKSTAQEQPIRTSYIGSRSCSCSPQ